MNARNLLPPSAARPFSFLVLLLLSVPAFYSQIQPLPPAQPPGKSFSIPINACAQADFLVFSRQGRFVDDLKKDQIELLVDDKPQQIAYFQLVTAGSPDEEFQWANARGVPEASPPAIAGSNPDHGRTILFFLDDLHMSAGSIARVRKALTRTIDSAMGPSDRVFIVSASNRIGFLRQMGNDRSESRAAVAQLTFRRPLIQDEVPPAMSEAQAAAIDDDNPGVLASFVKATMEMRHDSGKETRRWAEQHVRARASTLAGRSAKVSETMLAVLDDSLQCYAKSPGRKIVFFLSDGFHLRDQQSQSVGLLMQATDTATRGRIAIYTLNSRNLTAAEPEVGGAGTDSAGQSGAGESGEALMPQDGLGLLAVDSGGRFLRSPGALHEVVAKTLAETSRYYLLGWRFNPSMLRSGSSKSLKILVRDRSDLTVHQRQMSMDLARYLSQEYTKTTDDTIKDELLGAIRSPAPITVLPIYLYCGYLQAVDKKQLLTVTLQASGEASEASAGDTAPFEIMSVVLDENGVPVDVFRGDLASPKDLKAPPPGKQAAPSYTRFISIAPGLYQVRVASHDLKHCRTGSASEWIEVPPFPPDQLSLSSIYLLNQQAEEVLPTDMLSNPATNLELNAKRRFAPSDRLTYFLFIYNPVQPPNGSPVRISVQSKIFKGETIVARDDLHPVPAKSSADKGPVLYSAQSTLDGLKAGVYTLRIRVVDGSVNQSAEQRVSFWIQ